MTNEAIGAVAKAIYGSTHSARLSENPLDVPEYVLKAYNLLMAFKYLTRKERSALRRTLR